MVRRRVVESEGEEEEEMEVGGDDISDDEAEDDEEGEEGEGEDDDDDDEDDEDEEEDDDDDNEDEADDAYASPSGSPFDEHEGSAEPDDDASGTAAIPSAAPARALPKITKISLKSRASNGERSKSRDDSPRTSPPVQRIRVLIGGLSPSSTRPSSGASTPTSSTKGSLLKRNKAGPLSKSKSKLTQQVIKGRGIDDEDAMMDDDEDLELDDDNMDDVEPDAPGGSGSLSPVDDDLLEYSDDEDFSTSNELPDPTKLTARQRAAKLGIVDESLGESTTETAKRASNLSTEEAALKRSEGARRRKNLADQKLEEEKVETINRLLNKTVGKSRNEGDEEDGSSGAVRGGGGKKRFLKHDGEEGRIGVKFKWVDTVKESRMAIPQHALLLVEELMAKKAYPQREQCQAAHCQNAMKYRGRDGRLACSMAHLNV